MATPAPYRRQEPLIDLRPVLLVVGLLLLIIGVAMLLPSLAGMVRDMHNAEAFFGSQGKDTNQAAQFADETQAGSSVAGQMSDAHLRQYRNVLAAIRGEEPLRVTLAENRQAISIITGLYESARTGQPVRLDAVAAVAR